MSGGKDSVAMCDLLLKNKYPVDYIIFNDTTDEHDAMYRYIDKVEEYFLKRYGKKITRLNPVKTYKEYIFSVRTRGENIGKIQGLPNPAMVFCEWRRDSKILPMQKWIKEKDIKDYSVYFGFTTNERKRATTDMSLINNGTAIYPLINDFKMSEQDCFLYLEKQEMQNPLYKHFTRTGCAKCQYQSTRSWFMVWKHYNKKWQEVKQLEKEVKEHKTEATSYHFFNHYKTAEEMEAEFKKIDKQKQLFNLEDEPLKDCFCKI